MRVTEGVCAESVGECFEPVKKFLPCLGCHAGRNKLGSPVNRIPAVTDGPAHGIALPTTNRSGVEAPATAGMEIGRKANALAFGAYANPLLTLVHTGKRSWRGGGPPPASGALPGPSGPQQSEPRPAACYGSRPPTPEPQGSRKTVVRTPGLRGCPPPRS